MKHPDYIAVIVLVSLVIGIALLIAGCSTLKQVSGIEAGCSVKVKGQVEEMTVDCNHNLNKDADNAEVGVGAGT